MPEQLITMDLKKLNERRMREKEEMSSTLFLSPSLSETITLKRYSNMLTENLATLFERDIQKIKTEILAYSDESKLWLTADGVTNSGGNLCLHLLGNLQHYIGGILGNSGYIRNRPLEFIQKNIPVSETVATIELTVQKVTQTIRLLSEENLAAGYPEKVFDHSMSTEYFLLHLLAHLNYHLGQINFHRRLIG